MAKSIKKATDATSVNYKIRVLLHGLLVSEFVDNQFHVYALNSVVANHILSLNIYDIQDPSKNLENIEITEDSVIELNGINNVGINQYHGESCPMDDEDFCWVLNFNKIANVVKNPAKIGPKFILQNGSVRSLIRSSPLKFGKGAGAPQHGRIAQVVAVDIPVELSDKPILTVDVPTVSYKFEPTKRYNITFRYDCNSKGKFDPNKPVDVNHLYMAFGVISKKADFYHVYQNSTDVDNDMKQEIKRVLTNDADGLKGLGTIYFLNSRRVTRVDPCGIGFIGDP